MNEVQIIEGDIYSVRETFVRMAGDPAVFEREAGFAMQIIMNSDYAQKTALANRQSVINAVTNVAAIGISLNPAKRQAYLVPRDGKICLDIGYLGLLDLAIQSGSVLWGQSELVYEADTFQLQGFDKPPLHNRDPFSKDRGAMIGAYVVVKTPHSDYLTTAMNIDEIFDIRNRSAAWKKDQKGPWKTDEGEMVKKTVIKRAYKLWPKTDRLDKAVHFLNTEGGEGIELAQAESKQSFKSSARDALAESMASLPIDQQSYIRELADEVVALFTNDECGAPFAFDRIEKDQLENAQREALWYVLPSNVRSGLKKEGEARRKQQ